MSLLSEFKLIQDSHQKEEAPLPAMKRNLDEPQSLLRFELIPPHPLEHQLKNRTENQRNLLRNTIGHMISGPSVRMQNQMEELILSTIHSKRPPFSSTISMDILRGTEDEINFGFENTPLLDIHSVMETQIFK